MCGKTVAANSSSGLSSHIHYRYILQTNGIDTPCDVSKGCTTVVCPSFGIIGFKTARCDGLNTFCTFLEKKFFKKFSRNFH